MTLPDRLIDHNTPAGQLIDAGLTTHDIVQHVVMALGSESLNDLVAIPARDHLVVYTMKNMLRFTILAAGVLLPFAATAAAPEAAPVQALNAALIATMKAGSAGQSFDTRVAALAPVVESVTTWPRLRRTRSVSSGRPFRRLSNRNWRRNSRNSPSPAMSPSSPNMRREDRIAAGGKDGRRRQDRRDADRPGRRLRPTRLDYVVSDGPNGWQITDVLLNGTISQVAIHSSDFSSLVTSGDATQLIDALKKKTATLARSSGSL